MIYIRFDYHPEKSASGASKITTFFEYFGGIPNIKSAPAILKITNRLDFRARPEKPTHSRSKNGAMDAKLD